MNSEWKTTVATPGAGSASLASSQSTASAFSTATGTCWATSSAPSQKLEAPGLVRPHERHQREPVLGGARVERRGVATVTLGDGGGDVERRPAGGVGALEPDRRARVAPCLVALDVVVLGPAQQQAGARPQLQQAQGKPRLARHHQEAAQERGAAGDLVRLHRVVEQLEKAVVVRLDRLDETRATGRPSRFLRPRGRSGPARAPRPRAPACARSPSAAPRAGRTGPRPTADARPAVASTDPAPRRRRPRARAACRRGATRAPGCPAPQSRSCSASRARRRFGPQGAVVPALDGGAQRRRDSIVFKTDLFGTGFDPASAQPCRAAELAADRPNDARSKIAREGEQRAGVAQAQSADVAHAPVRAAGSRAATGRPPARRRPRPAPRGWERSRARRRAARAAASSGMPASVA